jgi:hypothetical protein
VPGRVDGPGVCQEHLDVLLPAQDPADGRRDVAGRQRRRRNLVEQRLEDVVIVPIDERHANGRPRQGARRVEATESTAENHDVRDHVFRVPPI